MVSQSDLGKFLALDDPSFYKKTLLFARYFSDHLSIWGA